MYSAGDVIGDPMFVYIAAYGGHLAADNAINGNSRRYALSALPRDVYRPHVASVGVTEEEARKICVVCLRRLRHAAVMPEFTARYKSR